MLLKLPKLLHLAARQKLRMSPQQQQFVAAVAFLLPSVLMHCAACCPSSRNAHVAARGYGSNFS